MTGVVEIGRARPRVEDAALLTGAPVFLADLPEVRGALTVAILRSPLAHARLRGTDTARAAALAGVRAVLTAADLAGAPTLPCEWFPPAPGRPALHPVLAADRVLYHGQPVAAVAAEGRAAALDALGAIALDLDPLPPVTDLGSALDPAAPVLHPGGEGNRAFLYARQGGHPDRAFDRADLRLALRLTGNRLAPAAMEGRAVLARIDAASGMPELWSSTQLPHVHARALAGCLGLPLNRLRYRVPAVGGGFGGKLALYAEEVIVAALAQRTGRACLWTEGRAEGFLATTHGRDHLAEVEIAAARDGRVHGLRARIRADLGAYALGMGPGVPAINAGHSLTGPYDIRHVAFTVEGIHTTRTPTGPYRGAGHPEATYLIERVMEAVADATGLDPVELRRRNLVPARRMPYRLATGLVLDTGDFAATLDAALRLADHPGLIAWRDARRAAGALAGVGVAMFSENSGAAPSIGMGAIGFRRAGHGSARVVVHPDGRATVFSGSMAQGQGHRTALAQIAAEALGLPFEHIEVVQGDIAAIPFGTGTYNSRSMAVGGTAVWRAAARIARKMRRIAAYRLCGRPSQVRLEGGAFRLARRGLADRIAERIGRRLRAAAMRLLTGLALPDPGPPPEALPFAEIAAAAHLGHDLPLGLSLGLDETEFFDPRDMPFAHGCHVIAVEIDPDTGHLGIRRHAVVDDAGTLVNPLLVEGQIHGGAAQDLGQALYEHLIHDAEGRGPTGGFAD